MQLFKDARYFQIIFQTLFLGYGIYFLGWKAEWWLYSTYFISSILLQAAFEYWFVQSQETFAKRFWRGLPSVLISSFGLCLLLKTNEFFVAVFAASVAIASKYLIRINGKHLFNPSALGIVVAILLTGKAWFSPGQWGSGVVLVFAVCCFGFIVLTRVQKLDTCLSFLLPFIALLFVRQVVYLGWPLDYFVQSVSTGSLLLFSFFMITDPKTIPNHPLARVLWCMAIAMLAFYFSAFKFLNGTPVWVLVCMQPLVPLLDAVFPAKKFEWLAINKMQQPKLAHSEVI